MHPRTIPCQPPCSVQLTLMIESNSQHEFQCRNAYEDLTGTITPGAQYVPLKRLRCYHTNDGHSTSFRIDVYFEVPSARRHAPHATCHTCTDDHTVGLPQHA